VTCSTNAVTFSTVSGIIDATFTEYQVEASAFERRAQAAELSYLATGSDEASRSAPCSGHVARLHGRQIMLADDQRTQW